MAKNQLLHIQPLGFEASVDHAARELQNYLPQLAPVRTHILPPVPVLPQNTRAQIVLAPSPHLTQADLGRLPTPSELDDELALIPHGEQLFITGSNPRSVLFAVYRLLEVLGAVFLRPGLHGEVLPRTTRLRLPLKPIREKASYRHRGICIGGSTRLEIVLEQLDWMAKKRMNT